MVDCLVKGRILYFVVRLDGLEVWECDCFIGNVVF